MRGGGSSISFLERENLITGNSTSPSLLLQQLSAGSLSRLSAGDKYIPMPIFLQATGESLQLSYGPDVIVGKAKAPLRTPNSKTAFLARCVLVLHTCTRAHTHTHAHAHTHTHMCTHVHTQTHTHMHTHILADCKVLSTGINKPPRIRLTVHDRLHFLAVMPFAQAQVCFPRLQ